MAEIKEHVILVAFTVKDEDREFAEANLRARLPLPNSVLGPDMSPITSWWVAEDDRGDGSDNDSAVFVKPGMQASARSILRIFGRGY